ncbi:MAG: arsenic resistance protein [Actinomycetia bacterium]|nr:arsenic resistance protein [Actinomycetes bacterium]
MSAPAGPRRSTRRENLERYQVWCYLGAVLLGLLLGSIAPAAGGPAGALVWPVLGMLLYATFTQMPLRSLAGALRDGRFLVAALVGNFVLIPALVWLLVQVAPQDPAIRLGLLLVLLVPCTDWFITFSALGRADPARATAITPITLIVQILLLPVYLWLLGGIDLASVFGWQELWPALAVVLLPLALAAVTELWVQRSERTSGGGSGLGRRLVERLAWAPVPLLAVVILLVALTHVGQVRDALHLLGPVLLIAAAYLVLALVAARVLAALAALPTPQGRTLAFSMATRNSFIVLPFALALPAGWEIAAIVVVTQSLVELLGMAVAIWFVPRVLFPGKALVPENTSGPSIEMLGPDSGVSDGT